MPVLYLAKGDTVEIVDKKGLSQYPFYKKIKCKTPYTVKEVKPTGAVIFEEIDLGKNMFGEVRGISPIRLRKIKGIRKPRTKDYV